ncbi:lactonase family protein [Psychromonas sp. KJ10-10]|uniref:lactonase family protein n=1 Tax=Psychromonas sp. KJ10-10 TaxID=3391823 RepID=UPI0039B53276
MNKEILYLGCYTPEGNVGIKVVEFDVITGQLKEIASVADLPDTSFLAVSKDKNYLLAVSECAGEGQLGCFDISKPKLPIFINKQSSMGYSPCHISLNAKKAFISNYSSGSVGAFSLSGHTLSPAYAHVQHQGQSSNLERQESAHAHASKLSIDGRFLVVADLGIDALKVYQVTEQQLDLVFTATMPAGSGPRHLTFGPKGDRLYLGNELSNEVSVFEFDVQQGSLRLLQTLSSLPNEFNGESLIAEVALSQDGKFLYVSNRGHDSICVFEVEPFSGDLKVIAFTNTGGKTPRHFALSPNQQWLLVAHQDSNYLQVFKRDINSGLLIQTSNKLEVKHAVCVCFYSL